MENQCYKAFLKQEPKFAALNKAFLDGIPVNSISRINNEKFGPFYSWNVDLGRLSREQLAILIKFFCENGIKIEDIKMQGISIPDIFLYQVLSPNKKEKLEAKFSYLSQTTVNQIMKDNRETYIPLDIKSLHFICLSCLFVLRNNCFDGFGHSTLEAILPPFIEILSQDNEDVKEFFKLVFTK